MHEYLIEGGFPIKGTITASGNKNAALPCIAAALLTEEKVILRNVPEIEDCAFAKLFLDGRIGERSTRITMISPVACETRTMM